MDKQEFLKEQIHRLWKKIKHGDVCNIDEYLKNRNNLMTLTQLLEETKHEKRT